MKVYLGGTALAVLAAVAWVFVAAGEPSAVRPMADAASGAQLYAANCASCHGADLEGQRDWHVAGPDGIYPAPPHDESGHTWHHDDAVLFAYIKFGGAEAMAQAGVEGFNSGMPAFQDDLSDHEIRDILAFIASTWPPRIRAAQAERSAE